MDQVVVELLGLSQFVDTSVVVFDQFYLKKWSQGVINHLSLIVGNPCECSIVKKIANIQQHSFIEVLIVDITNQWQFSLKPLQHSELTMQE